MPPRSIKARQDAEDASAHDGIAPNIDDLATFIQAYKRLQADNADLRTKLAGHVHDHEQARVQYQDAADAKHAELLKAMNEEMDLLRKEKSDLREGIEELKWENTVVASDMARLETEKSDLQHAVSTLNRSAEGLRQTIMEGNKRFDDFKDQVKAFANEL